MSQERLEDARLEYERVVARDPKAIAAHTIIAMILEAQHKTDEAQRRYERILEIDPYAVVAANNLAWMHVQRSQNLDIALELAQRAKLKLSSDPRVNDTLGWIYYQKNLAELALPLLIEGARSDAGNPLHHYHVGMAYVRLGDWPRARQALERALLLKPDFPGAEQAKHALVTIGG
jgi:tetratricopeptide (TPR) repeat protein